MTLATLLEELNASGFKLNGKMLSNVATEEGDEISLI
jgi:ribosomal protein L20